MRWLVERLLKPGTIEPDAVPLGPRQRRSTRRSSAPLRELAERGERIQPGTLDEASARVRVHLREAEARHPITSDPHRRVAELARVEADLVRYLEHAAEVGSTFSPGGLRAQLRRRRAPGGRPRRRALRARAHRPRRSLGPGGEAIIIDYKGRTKPKPAKRWLEEGLLQAGLYARALERWRPPRERGSSARCYQPIGADDDITRARLRGGGRRCRCAVAADRIDAERARRARSTRSSPRAGGRERDPRGPPRSRGPSAAAGTTQAARIPRSAGARHEDRPSRTARPAHRCSRPPPSRTATADARDGECGRRQDARARRALRARRAREPDDEQPIGCSTDPRDHLHAQGRGRAAHADPRALHRSSARTPQARDVERAWILTIDGFCLRVLRSHAVLAGLDPAFDVLDGSRPARAARRSRSPRRWRAGSATPQDAAHGSAAPARGARLRRAATAILQHPRVRCAAPATSIRRIPPVEPRGPRTRRGRRSSVRRRGAGRADRDRRHGQAGRRGARAPRECLDALRAATASRAGRGAGWRPARQGNALQTHGRSRAAGTRSATTRRRCGRAGAPQLALVGELLEGYGDGLRRRASATRERARLHRPRAAHASAAARASRGRRRAAPRGCGASWSTSSRTRTRSSCRSSRRSGSRTSSWSATRCSRSTASGTPTSRSSSASGHERAEPRARPRR